MKDWKAQWRKAFEAEFSVPSEIREHKQLLHVSDVLHSQPIYQIEGTNLYLIMDMPYVTQKPDMLAKRFTFVEYYGAKVFCTNDLKEALDYIKAMHESELEPGIIGWLVIKFFLIISIILSWIPQRKKHVPSK